MSAWFWVNLPVRCLPAASWARPFLFPFVLRYGVSFALTGDPVVRSHVFAVEFLATMTFEDVSIEHVRDCFSWICQEVAVDALFRFS